MLEAALKFVPIYVLVLFRIAGMMVYAPLLGSDRIPRRVKALIACVLAASVTPGLASMELKIPTNPWELAVGIGGEIAFGLGMGMILSFIFVAAQWSGEMIGQQMGLNLGQTFDPQFGSQGSIIGDLYFFLTLVVFLVIDGHRAMLMGVSQSFHSLPLLSASMNRPLLGNIVGCFQGATSLAVEMAAPMLVTMLVVDLVLGFVGKTLPQLNILSAGISLRSLVGIVVLIIGLSLTSSVIRDALQNAMKMVYLGYSVN
jgi:flagellar biosynthetic protein FliR